MCGIAGIVGNLEGTQANEIVQEMALALSHRGPDFSSSRFWQLQGKSVALGHTRLSILDLSSAGNQPMTEDTGRYFVVFNGEIYNFQELRKLLDPERRYFRTATDTEAILHAYRRWSVDSFSKLRGMFAFALLDIAEHKLHLVRDPLGIKPLYYFFRNGEFLFASEVRALLRTGRVSRRLNEAAIGHFLTFGCVGPTETIIEGVQALQPGHTLTVDLSVKNLALSAARYEPPPKPHVERSNGDRNESAAHMLHLLEQSVKCHLVSDVPIGLFLSGGIDSSAILHLMRQAGCNSPKTFTVVFGEKDFNESQFAKRVAARYDAEHQEIHVGEAELLATLPAALDAMDQPTMDGVNTFVISRAVRTAGVKVALSGLGADELFAGYPSFRRLHWAKRVSRVPHSIRKGCAVVGRWLHSRARTSKLWDLVASDCSPRAVYRVSRQLFGNDEIAGLTKFYTALETETQSRLVPDEINEISRLELEGYMTNLLLRDTDFMSMASSLEVRVPFIDKVVVRYALQLPGAWKVDRPVPKEFLLESMRGAIPDYVWKRRKMGFAFPFDRWMRSTLRPELVETLSDKTLARNIDISSSAVGLVWSNFLENRARWSKAWSLFVLLRWCQRHQVSV